VSFPPSQTDVQVLQHPALKQTDVGTVSGCAFTIGPKASPCRVVRWQPAGMPVKHGGVELVCSGSVGLCFSPEQAAQGLAMIVATQAVSRV
jgi:hypothetical protein